MSSNTVTIVCKRDHVPSVDVLTKAIEKYNASYSFATVDPEEEIILCGRGAFDPTETAKTYAELLMGQLKTHYKQYRVIQFSKEPLTQESLQPFSVFNLPGETEEEEGPDKIVAFLAGDYSAKMQKDSPHSGEFWAHVEDTRPALMELLQECADENDGAATAEAFAKKWKEKNSELTKKVFVNEDNAMVILLWNGECLIAGEKEAGEGHNEQDYWISQLLDEPTSVPVVPKKKDMISLAPAKKKPVQIASVEPIKQPDQVKPTVEIAKMTPPAWSRGSNESSKKFYRSANAARDSQGVGIVPSKWQDGVAVDVDVRVRDAILGKQVNSQNDLNLFLAKLRTTTSDTAIDAATAKVEAGNVESGGKKAAPVQHVDRNAPQSFIKTLTAQEKSTAMDWVPIIKSGNSPAEIQADEKELPTFKEVTGLSWDDLRKATFRRLHEEIITKSPKAATLLIFDLLHRPSGTIRGTVGTPPADTPVVPTKNKAAGIKLA